MSVTIQLWRIATDAATYVATDLTGAGAQKSGGRWNRIGTPMIYAAPSIALAVLETVVHVDHASGLPFNRYLVRIDVPASLWAAATVFDKTGAGVGWDALPAGKVSLDWGTNWCTSGAAAIAKVPSVIVPEEVNILINPKHPDAKAITATKIRRWDYDPRLMRAP